jgi:hypothetical protein
MDILAYNCTDCVRYCCIHDILLLRETSSYRTHDEVLSHLWKQIFVLWLFPGSVTRHYYVLITILPTSLL